MNKDMDSTVDTYFDALRSSLQADMPVNEVESIINNAPSGSGGGLGTSGMNWTIWLSSIALVMLGTASWYAASLTSSDEIPQVQQEAILAVADSSAIANAQTTKTTELPAKPEVTEVKQPQTAPKAKPVARVQKAEKLDLEPLGSETKQIAPLPPAAPAEPAPLFAKAQQEPKPAKDELVRQESRALEVPKRGQIIEYVLDPRSSDQALDSMTAILQENRLTAVFKSSYAGGNKRKKFKKLDLHFRGLQSEIDLELIEVAPLSIRIMESSKGEPVHVSLVTQTGATIWQDALAAECKKCSEYEVIGLVPGSNRKDWSEIRKNGLYGIINADCKVVLKPQFDRIDPFGMHHSNWALVQKNGCYGFIDRQGSIVVPPNYHSIGMFGKYFDHWAMVSHNGLKGFINNQGQKVVPVKYDRIAYFGTYQENFALVESNGLFGFIDQTGREVVSPKYDLISRYTSLKNSWAMVEYNGLKGFIDKDGKEVVRTAYDAIERFDLYQKDWALVQKNGLYGFINGLGQEIISPKYHRISPFNEYKKGWALVEHNGLFGFIDALGNEVVPLQYDRILPGNELFGMIGEEKHELTEVP